LFPIKKKTKKMIFCFKLIDKKYGMLWRNKYYPKEVMPELQEKRLSYHIKVHVFYRDYTLDL